MTSAFDKNLYRQIVSRATMRYEFHQGTTDEHVTQAAVTVNGAPQITRCGSVSVLRQTAAADCVYYTANAAQRVDCSQSFSFEWFGVPVADDLYVFTSYTATGGIEFRWRGDVMVFLLNMYDAAGALARQFWYGPVPTTYLNRPVHFVVSSGAGGTVGLACLDGVPVVLVPVGAGVPARGAVSPHYIAGLGGGAAGTLWFRAYPEARTQADVNALWGSASVLAGRWAR